MKDKTIWSFNCRISIWQDSTLVHKNNKKLKIGGNFPNTIKAIYEKPKANIIFNGEKLKTFPIKFRTKQRCPLLTFLYSIVLEVLARVIK